VTDTAARLLWVEQLKRYTDEEFVRVAAQKIWLTNYYRWNPDKWAEYFSQAVACGDEAIRRGDESLYDQAWRQATKEVNNDW
jgi:hypothetical protein